MFRSKRSRGESSSSHEPTPLELAEQRLQLHRAQIASWVPVQEREIALPRIPAYRKFHDAIRELGWGTFTSTPTKPVIPLVREFYAQLHTSWSNEVTVFGTRVRFDVDTINEALGITRIPNLDMYKRLRQNLTDIDMHEVQHTLSLGKRLERCRDRYTVKVGSLPKEAWVWRKFCNGRLLGIEKDGEVNELHQCMLFCIVTRKRFNVGEIIYDRIDHLRTQLHKDKWGKTSMPFPCLITYLCRGVPRQEGFRTKQNMKPIDESKVGREEGQVMSMYDFHLQNWGGRGTTGWEMPTYDDHPALPAPPLGYEIPREDEEGEDNEPPHGHPQHPNFFVNQESWDQMNDRIGTIEQRMTDLTRSMQNMDTKYDLFYDEMSSFMRDYRGNHPPPPPQ